MLLLPLLWTIMLDAGTATGKGGLAEFVAQLYNVAAAMATFGIAIKLAQGVMRRAHSGIGALSGAAPAPGAGHVPRSGGAAAGPLTPKTQQSLATFSQGIRGRIGAVAASTSRGAMFPVRHPIGAAQAVSYPARRPVQATREAAGGLRDALAHARISGATIADGARTQATGWYENERHGGRFSSRSSDKRRQTTAAVADNTRPTASNSPAHGPTRPQRPPTRASAAPRAANATSRPPADAQVASPPPPPSDPARPEPG